jgi:hypothetical protein
MLLVLALVSLGSGLSSALLMTPSAADKTQIATLFGIAFGIGTSTIFVLVWYLTRVKS